MSIGRPRKYKYPDYIPPTFGVSSMPGRRYKFKPFNGFLHDLLKRIPVNTGFIFDDPIVSLRTTAEQYGMVFKTRKIMDKLWLFVRIK